MKNDAAPRIVAVSLRSEASDPSTPPQRLRELAGKGYGRVVAENPNASPDLLLKLARHYFDEFSRNPVVPLLLLENPGFCMQIAAATLRRLLRRADIPATFIHTLQRHPDP